MKRQRSDNVKEALLRAAEWRAEMAFHYPRVVGIFSADKSGGEAARNRDASHALGLLRQEGLVGEGSRVVNTMDNFKAVEISARNGDDAKRGLEYLQDMGIAVNVRPAFQETVLRRGVPGRRAGESEPRDSAWAEKEKSAGPHRKGRQQPSSGRE